MYDLYMVKLVQFVAVEICSGQLVVREVGCATLQLIPARCIVSRLSLFARALLFIVSLYSLLTVVCHCWYFKYVFMIYRTLLMVVLGLCRNIVKCLPIYNCFKILTMLR